MEKQTSVIEGELRSEFEATLPVLVDVELTSAEEEMRMQCRREFEIALPEVVREQLSQQGLNTDDGVADTLAEEVECELRRFFEEERLPALIEARLDELAEKGEQHHREVFEETLGERIDNEVDKCEEMEE